MRRRSFILTTALLIAPATGAVAAGTAATGTLYFTTFNGGNNVNKVNYSYDGLTTFTLGTATNIAATPGADGIIFAPDGSLLVGGQGTGNIYKVNAVSGAYTSASTSQVGSFHLSLDPSGQKVYSFGQGGDDPGPVGVVPLNPFANGSHFTLSGDATDITAIAFDGSGNAYYTASSSGGNGSVGTINMSTGVTTQVRTNLPAAHGMIYDAFSGKLMLVGAGHITQLNTNAGLTTYSDLDLSADNLKLDQSATDGAGHLLAADNNNGDLIFLDYSQTQQVGSAGFQSVQFLANSLDDVAPLAGLGSAATPEPGAIAMAGSLLVIGAAFRRRRK